MAGAPVKCLTFRCLSAYARAQSVKVRRVKAVSFNAFGLSAFYLLAKNACEILDFSSRHGTPDRLEASGNVADAGFVRGAVFMLINAGKTAQAIWVGVGLVCWEMVLRSLFLRVEIKCLREKSAKWTYRGARKQVQRRSLSDTMY